MEMRQYRHWSPTTFGRHYRPRRNDHRFIVTSYNILAQFLVDTHKELYSENVREHLQWSHRLNLIVAEIIALHPKILTLQEVQLDHLNEIENSLASLQYAKPLYKKRAADNQKDGCAIFYDPKEFRLIEHHFVDYYQPSAPTQLNRTNVAIIAKFASNRTKDMEFIVTTTHLLFNPKREDVRIAQLQVLIAELDRVAVHTKTGESLPIILAGDFNSMQFSRPYRLVADGSIDAESLPIELEILDNCQHFTVATNQIKAKTKLWKSNDQKTEEPKENDPSTSEQKVMISQEKIKQLGLQHNTGRLNHKFRFVPTFCGDWVASTFQNQWLLVDFIFYTKFKCRSRSPEPPQYSPLQVLANYQLPSIKQCTHIGPIPNAHFGSDHYSLSAEFVFLTYP